MRHSAALLVYRRTGDALDVFLVHPGGPFWARKDLGAWSIPKGEFEKGEDGLVAARREFLEEVGQEVDGDFVALTPRRQKSGKIVHPWAVEGEVDETRVRSNEFELEWPPRSGRKARFPEVDQGRWFPLAEARRRILPGQVSILEELAARLA
ncbi:MAG TPA: NUDIX domain-containing protein [Dongiaceae bacterium]|nr:NUDIX domain-containing protein [Dongiaceae bacterium]